MAGIYSQGGSAGHRYAGWLETVEAKNFQFGGKVFNGSPSAIYVGSNLVWSYWLKHATWEAIVGAFGQRDGMAVIKATNAYLNQLAASGQAGKDKATALAGFINEDPMMVCSLGLSVEGVTMPIRWLDNGGSSYINLHAFSSNNTYEMLVKYNSYDGENVCFSAGRVEIFTSPGRNGKLCYFNGVTQVSDYDATSICEVSICVVDNDFNVNGTDYTVVNQYAISENIGLWNYMGGALKSNSKLGKLKELSGQGVIVHWYIPFKRSGVMELIDLETGALATRVGTFTESYTLPDGTPWTPLNQQ